MRRVLGLLLVAGLVGGSACGDSGQTGSASCDAPSSCGCTFLESRMLFRATTLEVRPEVPSATFRIEQVLTSSRGILGSEPGFLIEARPSRFNPSSARAERCTGALDALPAVGEVVLLSTRWVDDVCPGCDAGACRCADATIQLPDASYLPWQESYDFGGEILTPAELVPLTEYGACQDPFPPPPFTECNDTPAVESGPGCGK